MKSVLPFLYKTASRGRRVFSLKLFVLLLFIGLASFSAEITSYDFVPAQFDPVLISISSYAVLSLPIIPVMNRLFYALEWIFIRLYLNIISPEETEILSKFLATKRMVDVQLDLGLSQVKQLVSMNIIYPETDLTFMAGDKRSSAHAYYSMTTWVFYHLIKKSKSAGDSRSG